MTNYWQCGVAVLLAAALVRQAAGEPPPTTVDLRSEVLVPGVTMRETKQPVSQVQLMVRLDKKGSGTGTLVLNANMPEIDEFGTAFLKGNVPPSRLDCEVKFVKKGRVQVRAGPPPEEWLLYQIIGPKITTRLFVATPGPGLAAGRLVVWRDDMTVAAVVPLAAPPSGPPLPCHPGCFPAGTTVAVPGGVRPIEGIRSGDEVITIGRDGEPAPRRVTEVFVTRNRLVEVRTDDGVLATTETQPLCRVSDDFRPAGGLVAGDRIWRWAAGERREAVVREVTPAGREVRVYNLVIGDQVVFVAGGFMARCKPPAANTAELGASAEPPKAAGR